MIWKSCIANKLKVKTHGLFFSLNSNNIFRSIICKRLFDRQKHSKKNVYAETLPTLFHVRAH